MPEIQISTSPDFFLSDSAVKYLKSALQQAELQAKSADVAIVIHWEEHGGVLPEEDAKELGKLKVSLTEPEYRREADKRFATNTIALPPHLWVGFIVGAAAQKSGFCDISGMRVKLRTETLSNVEKGLNVIDLGENGTELFLRRR